MNVGTVGTKWIYFHAHDFQIHNRSHTHTEVRVHITLPCGNDVTFANKRT